MASASLSSKLVDYVDLARLLGVRSLSDHLHLGRLISLKCEEELED